MTKRSAKPTVAVIGAGILGKGMIKNLQQARLSLRLYNRTSASIQKFASHDTVICTSPAEAAKGAEVILSVVADDAASEEVWFGPEGVVQTVSTQAVGIECSTLSVLQIDSWSKRLQERGVGAVDCPVTGSKGGAESGTLILFVGGQVEWIEQAKPVLEAISQRLHHLGETGSGSRFKLMYNTLSGTILVALAEAFALSQTFGLNLHHVYEILQLDGGWSAAVTKGKGQAMLEDKHEDVWCQLDYLKKDLAYAFAAVEGEPINLPTSEQALKSLEFAARQGLGHLDMSAIGRLYLKERGEHEGTQFGATLRLS